MASAQTAPAVSTAIVRGVVASATGEPLQYAVVSIPSLDLQLFTNNAGRFVFTGVQAGTYRLSVRQLGYTAVLLDVTLSAGETRDVAVRMNRIVTTLATMTVLADVPCRKPGRPSALDSPELAEVFEQLEQNAVRMKLLSVVYPYDAVTERIRFFRHGDGLETVESRDSLRSPNQQAARYRPGNVVVERRAPPTLKSLARRGMPRESYLQIPTLLDFADARFQDNHCFYLRGLEQVATGLEVRVDFKPAEKLKTPDVSGTVYLEPKTYTLLRADIELTKIPKNLNGLARVQALTYFDELLPGLPMVGEIVATSDLQPATRMAPTQSVERLITLRVLFHKEIPEALRRDTSGTILVPKAKADSTSFAHN